MAPTVPFPFVLMLFQGGLTWELVPERIASAPHSADWVSLLAANDGLPKPADVDVDRALIDVNVAAPNAVEKLCAGEDAPILVA